MDAPPAPAQSTLRLRGDYAHAAADYTVIQDPHAYSPTDQRVWAHLLHRQRELLPRYATVEFMQGLEALQLGDSVPSLERSSELLRRRTGWELVGVPGLIPEKTFFEHLSKRRFPVTVWLRREDELDYLAEPDLFHDFFGHVPLLTDPAYADFVELYGHAGKRAMELGALHMLARLYWYGIEFGLIESAGELRSYGAGILSSHVETKYALDDARPLRIRFDLQRVLRTGYLIDDLQRNYFVVRSFRELVDTAVHTDFEPIYREYAAVSAIEPGQRLPQDEIVPTAAGRVASAL